MWWLYVGSGTVLDGPHGTLHGLDAGLAVYRSFNSNHQVKL